MQRDASLCADRRADPARAVERETASRTHRDVATRAGNGDRLCKHRRVSDQHIAISQYHQRVRSVE